MERCNIGLNGTHFDKVLLSSSKTNSHTMITLPPTLRSQIVILILVSNVEVDFQKHSHLGEEDITSTLFLMTSKLFSRYPSSLFNHHVVILQNYPCL